MGRKIGDRKRDESGIGTEQRMGVLPRGSRMREPSVLATGYRDLGKSFCPPFFCPSGRNPGGVIPKPEPACSRPVGMAGTGVWAERLGAEKWDESGIGTEHRMGVFPRESRISDPSVLAPGNRGLGKSFCPNFSALQV